MIGIIKLEKRDGSYKKTLRFSDYRDAERTFKDFQSLASKRKYIDLVSSIYLYSKDDGKNTLISVLYVSDSLLDFIRDFKI